MRKASTTSNTAARGESWGSAEEAEQSKVGAQSSSTKTQPRLRHISSRMSTRIKHMMNRDSKDGSSPLVGEKKSPVLSDDPIVPPKLEFYESMERNVSTEKKVVRKDTYEPSAWAESSDWKVIPGDSDWAGPSWEPRSQAGKKPYSFAEPDRVYGPSIGSKKEEAGEFIRDRSPKKPRYAPTRDISKHRDEEEAAMRDVISQFENKKRDYQPNNDFGAFATARDMPDPHLISREELESSSYTCQVKHEKQRKKDHEREKQREKDRQKERERERIIYGPPEPSHHPFQAPKHTRSETDASKMNEWPWGEHTESYTKPRGIPRSHVCADLYEIREEAKRQRAAEEEKRRSQRKKHEERIEQARREKEGYKKSHTEALNVPSLEELRRRQAESTKYSDWRPQSEEEEDQEDAVPFFVASKTAHSQKLDRQPVAADWENAPAMPQREVKANDWAGIYSLSSPKPQHSQNAAQEASDPWQSNNQREYQDPWQSINKQEHQDPWQSKVQQEHQDPWHKPALSRQDRWNNDDDDDKWNGGNDKWNSGDDKRTYGGDNWTYSEHKWNDSDGDGDDTMWSAGEHEIPAFPKPPSHRGLPHSMASMNMGPDEKAKYWEELKKLSAKSVGPPSQPSHGSSDWQNEELTKHVANYGPVSPFADKFDQSPWPAPLNIRKKDKASASAKNVQSVVKDAQLTAESFQLAVNEEYSRFVDAHLERATKEEEKKRALKKEEERWALKEEETPVAPVSRLSRSATRNITSINAETAASDNTSEDLSTPVTLQDLNQLGEKFTRFFQRMDNKFDALQGRVERAIRRAEGGLAEED
ncbi:hypothetical protein F4776DRAFT_675739 [Hypoxylon sp. NC0597]|nr:hypothetical protein F4776DRAFT_675739 [Hypoxylon sp. NC0597]